MMPYQAHGHADTCTPGHRRAVGSWFVLAVVITASALLVWHTVERDSEHRARQHELLTESLNHTAREIELEISGMRRSLRMFAHARLKQIQHLAYNPDDADALTQLEDEFASLFPEAHALTIADSDGTPLLLDFDAKISAVCLTDLAAYARGDSTGTNTVYIHPQPFGYHIDLMVPVSLGEDRTGVFFASFLPGLLTRHLSENRLPNHKMLLLHREKQGLIELSDTGTRDKLEREFFLAPNEQERIRHQIPVAGSLWNVVALPPADEGGLLSSRAWQEAMWAFGALFLVGGSALWWLRRSEHRVLSQNQIMDQQASELRQSHHLLSAINKAQSNFIADNNPHELFNGMLADMLALTESEYGVIGEILHRADGTPYLRTHAITGVAGNEESQYLDADHASHGMVLEHLDTLFRAVITSGEPVISNTPESDPRIRNLPDGLPKLHAFLGLPIYSGQNPVGMLGVANRPSGYDRGICDYLEPFLSTCGNIIQAYRNESQRVRAERTLRTNVDRLHQLQQITSTAALDFDAKLKQLLALGVREYGLRIGILAQIEGAEYRVAAAVAPGDAIKKDAVFPLGETYCNETLRSAEPISFTHAQTCNRWAAHPAYRAFGLESYIGARVTVGGTVWGTLNFSSAEPSGQPFDSADLEFLKLMAQWVGGELDRLQGGQLIRDSESRVRAILDTVVDGVITVDEAGIIADFNPAAEAIFGYAAADVLGKNVALLIPMQNVSEHSEDITRYLRSNAERFAGIPREALGRRRDGSTFPMELAISAMALDQQQMFTASVRDITSAKQAQEELMSSNALRQAILDGANFTIISTDTQGIIQSFNTGAQRMLGYTEAEVIGQVTPEIIHDTDEMAARAKALSRELGRVIPPSFEVFVAKARLGVPDENEWSYIRKDGSRFPVLLSVTSLRDDHGEIIGFLGIGRDISEEQRTQKDLNRFKSTLDRTLDCVFMFEPDTLKFFYVNQGAMDQIGYTPTELMNMTPADIKPEFTEDAFRQLVSPLIAGEQNAITIETVHRHKSGRDIPVEVFLQYIAPTGESPRFVAIVRDISERKKIDRMKNEFISTVSHELRTPLTSIRGSLGLLIGGMSAEISAQAKALIEIADKNSERLVNLINDILDIEKIVSGKMRFTFKTQALEPLVRQAIEANAAFAAQFGVEFRFENHAPHVNVCVDNERLIQVLTNLLSNAAKFSPPNGIVNIITRVSETVVRVSVTDRGPGIPEAFRDMIFQKFSQADASDSRKKSGTGLGLSIAKNLIERMQGTIGFETEPDRETTFFFELPVIEQAQRAAFNSPAHKANILVCEDDADVAQLLANMLRRAGFSTTTAYTAQEAKQELSHREYDAITLDILLPDQDGISLIRELRANGATRHLPIVVVSAVAAEKREELNGDAISIVDWLPKPLDEERLQRALHLALHRTVGTATRVLHVEDDPDVVSVTDALIADAEVDHSATVADARRKLLANSYDLIILDVALPDGSGLDLLPISDRDGQHVPVLIFSACEVGEESARQVSATLVKSRTSNARLLDTIKSFISA